MDAEDAAEFVLDRARRDPKVAKIVEDVRIFDGLREHAGWRRLYEKVGVDQDRFLAHIARRLMSGQEVAQREIDFHRGFYQGALWVLGHPEEAEKSLERAAQKAWAAAKLEASIRDEGDSPYV